MEEKQIEHLSPVYVTRFRNSWEKNCLKMLGQDLYNKSRGLPENWIGTVEHGRELEAVSISEIEGKETALNAIAAACCLMNEAIKKMESPFSLSHGIVYDFDKKRFVVDASDENIDRIKDITGVSPVLNERGEEFEEMIIEYGGAMFRDIRERTDCSEV